MRWFRKKTITDDLKTVTEIAGDQIAPGVGTYALVLGGLAVAAAGAYVLHQQRKNKRSDGQAKPSGRATNKRSDGQEKPSGRATNKKAADQAAASSKSDKPG